MIRVLLADDHAIVRHGLRRLVDDQPDMEVVAEAEDAAGVHRALAETTCDVLVLDLSLPDGSGIEILRRLQAEGARTRVLILTMYPEDQLALHLLREGAAGYLRKSRPPDEVVRAIRKVASGGRYLTDTLSDLLLLEGGESAPGAPHERLTARESQVFVRLVEGHSVSAIAAELDVSPSTISNHVAAVRTKLGASSVADLVRYAVRAGLVEP
ncbi:MAG: response regulator transcription factor [Myxococcota bacterium]